MRVKNKIFFIVFILLEFIGRVFFPGYAAAESPKAIGEVVRKEIFPTGAAPEKKRLNLVSSFALTVDGERVGSIALYDDPATERPADYLELYDHAGNLLAVSWFDRFGIERTAVDRGILEDADKPEGIFVILLAGESL